jgi:glyoxylase-like metal-dependent hydrolase (beta-lactamase superfamily II)
VTTGQEPAETGAESLARAARVGIHQLSVPTPFLVGRVNCYLIEDDPVTLVDTGPNSGKSLDELERALAEYGRTIEDLELIVITHQHMDHLGLLEILARRSGAQVAAYHALTGYLENFSASAAADDEFSQAIMRRHGVPDDLATVLGSVGMAFRSFRVFHRPGHSPSDTIFWDEQRGLLLAGDHLLAHISSNPLLSRPLTDEHDSERPHALIDYMDSMRATRELEAELVLCGHGEPIVDHVALIDERFRMHQRRARKVRSMLASGPLSAYEIAVAMWGNIAVTQAYLTISEVLGHLDLLVRDGQVREVDDNGVARFQAVT